MTQPDPALEHVELAHVDLGAPVDHPDDLTDDEAAAGHEVYLAVDDLDDNSNGVDHPDELAP